VNLRSLGWIVLAGVVVASGWLCLAAHGTTDTGFWTDWIGNTRALGPVHGYLANEADYPPGASFALWLTSAVADPWGARPSVTIKLLLSFHLVATTLVVLWATKRPWVAAFVHAALTPNVALMYLDVLTAPWLVGAIWAASAGRDDLLLMLLAAACVMKWQPVFVVPFALVFLALRRRTGDRGVWRTQVGRGMAFVCVLTALLSLVYGFGPLIDAFYRASRHNNLSNFGANPWWVVTWIREAWAASNAGIVVDIKAASRPTLRFSTLLTLTSLVLIARRYWKSEDASVETFLRYALVGYCAYFLTSTGVHENHLFIATVLALALAWQSPRETWTAAVVIAAATANLVFFYGWLGGPVARPVYGIDRTVWLAMVISVAIGVIVVHVTRRARSTRRV
jgi:hypothetical protein